MSCFEPKKRPPSLNWEQGNAEPQAVAAVARVVDAPVGRTAVAGVVAPRAAAEDAERARGRPHGVTGGAGWIPMLCDRRIPERQGLQGALADLAGHEGDFRPQVPDRKGTGNL